MSYTPAGQLPTAAQLAGLSNTTPLVKSIAFTHGGTDLDLTSGQCQPCATSLYCLTPGNIVATLVGDLGAATAGAYTPTDQTYPVVAGTVLTGAFVRIRSSSTADCVARC